MKKLQKLREKVEELHEKVCPELSTKPTPYWTGGDWQKQGLEYAYTKVLKEIDKIIDSK